MTIPIYCPVCGEETEGIVFGRIQPHPTEPCLECVNCNTWLRIGFYEVEKPHKQDKPKD